MRDPLYFGGYPRESGEIPGVEADGEDPSFAHKSDHVENDIDAPALEQPVSEQSDGVDIAFVLGRRKEFAIEHQMLRCSSDRNRF